VNARRQTVKPSRRSPTRAPRCQRPLGEPDDGEQPAIGIGGGSTLYDCQGKADAIDHASETAPRAADTPTPGGVYPGGVDTDELERCLSEQGVTLPLSGDGMPDLTDPDLTAALQECGLPAAAGESAPG
jgi:hypothetical protein